MLVIWSEEHFFTDDWSTKPSDSIVFFQWYFLLSTPHIWRIDVSIKHMFEISFSMSSLSLPKNNNKWLLSFSFFLSTDYNHTENKLCQKQDPNVKRKERRRREFRTRTIVKCACVEYLSLLWRHIILVIGQSKWFFFLSLCLFIIQTKD